MFHIRFERVRSQFLTLSISVSVSPPGQDKDRHRPKWTTSREWTFFSAQQIHSIIASFWFCLKAFHLYIPIAAAHCLAHNHEISIYHLRSLFIFYCVCHGGYRVRDDGCLSAARILAFIDFVWDIHKFSAMCDIGQCAAHGSLCIYTQTHVCITCAQFTIIKIHNILPFNLCIMSSTLIRCSALWWFCFITSIYTLFETVTCNSIN